MALVAFVSCQWREYRVGIFSTYQHRVVCSVAERQSSGREIEWLTCQRIDYSQQIATEQCYHIIPLSHCINERCQPLCVCVRVCLSFVFMVFCCCAIRGTRDSSDRIEHEGDERKTRKKNCALRVSLAVYYIMSYIFPVVFLCYACLCVVRYSTLLSTRCCVCLFFSSFFISFPSSSAAAAGVAAAARFSFISIMYNVGREQSTWKRWRNGGRSIVLILSHTQSHTDKHSFGCLSFFFPLRLVL